MGVSVSGQKSDPPRVGYDLVASRLREGIADGTWAEGEPLPTDLELSEQFDTSRHTARRAYACLMNEGLVYRVPGRGTFVVPKDRRYQRPMGSIEDLVALSTDTEVEITEPLSGVYDREIAARLELDSSLLYAIGYLRFHQGKQMCHSLTYLTPQSGVVLEKDPELRVKGARRSETVIGSLMREGIDIAGAEQEITASAASPELADTLGCEEGDPLLVIERTFVDARGVPVEFAITHFLPSMYTNRLYLGRASRAEGSARYQHGAGERA